jgi:hypothetical protein
LRSPNLTVHKISRVDKAKLPNILRFYMKMSNDSLYQFVTISGHQQRWGDEEGPSKKPGSRSAGGR